MLVGVFIAVIGIGSSIGWYVKTADSINEMYNYVKKTEADVQTQLQSRFDQVPNLVEIVKGAEKHEQGITDTITYEGKKTIESPVKLIFAGRLDKNKNIPTQVAFERVGNYVRATANEVLRMVFYNLDK